MISLSPKSIFIICTAVAFGAALESAILSPDQREINVGSANELLSIQPVLLFQTEIDKIGDPFSRSRLVDEIVEEIAEEVLELDDDAVLERVSEALVPDGVFEVNGVYFALFNGVRVKKGDTMVRSYRDQEYEVIFDELDNSAFSIRYGEARLRIKLK